MHPEACPERWKLLWNTAAEPVSPYHLGARWPNEKCSESAQFNPLAKRHAARDMLENHIDGRGHILEI
jgi:hypothetical protein